MPPASECALTYVVFLHFPANSTSHLVEILGQYTSLTVSTAGDGQTLEPGHVYVVPPGMLATLADDRVALTGIDRVRTPIDTLFCSLAGAYGKRAIGVVLSGTGSDGTHGIEAICAKDGLTVAQREGGGGHPEMPANAVATGMVDHVLPVEEIPACLAGYCRDLASGAVSPPVGVPPHRLKGVKDELCRLLQEAVRHDFSRYKAATFLRRVGRRMRVLKISDWGAYVEHAQAHPDEVLLLFRDLLIGVTAFFRDGAAFQTLADRFLPRLFEGKGPGDKFRVWVPGCSSGEEAYSIAILLREHAKGLPTSPEIQVFATDVDEAALRIARAGRYPAAALAGMPQERTDRFFVPDGDSVMVTRELRALCTFAAHSLVRDPPLCVIDLISCRNVMIYFERNLQDQVIPTFHFALRPGGLLFLGPSETVGRFTDLFHPLDPVNRVFERVGNIRRMPPFLPPSGAKSARRGGSTPAGKARTVAHSAEAQVLRRHAPANVVVDGHGDIVHFSPRTGKYLEPIAGKPNESLPAMARKRLRAGLRGAMQEAKNTGCIAVRAPVPVDLDAGVAQKVQIAVEPLDHDGPDPLWLVTFQDVGAVEVPMVPSTEDTGAAAVEMAALQLERELLDTQEQLRAAIDENEIAVEELRSSNEELLSMNDDLQASNEEMEASKEELHVVNDELRAVNVDYAAKIDELKMANGDLRNLFESTTIGVIFLDCDQVIRSFTPAVTEMFRLLPSDCGRRLADIACFLDYATLTEDVAAVVATDQAVERAIGRRDGGAHYLLRLIPYRNLAGEMEGVLLTLVNVTAAVEAQAQERYHRLLIAELNHRVKNILTVAASLAAQSLRGTSGPDEFAKVFMDRLQALAGAQMLLADENWANVPLKTLVTAALQLQIETGGRVKLHGPPLRVGAKAATTLSLAIHELTTNATKYGAFANTSGRIDIGWTREVRPDGEYLVIRWRESGGPPVLPPSRKGFGTEMIGRGIRYELRGDARIDYLPAGIEVWISVPLDGLSQSAAGRAPNTPA